MISTDITYLLIHKHYFQIQFVFEIWDGTAYPDYWIYKLLDIRKRFWVSRKMGSMVKKLNFFWKAINPLRPTAIQKLLEFIGRVRLYPSCSFATALDADTNQTTGSGGHLSMWENRCMHAAVCLLSAGQPRSVGDAEKLGQFMGQFSWVTGDPIGLKGLFSE